MNEGLFKKHIQQILSRNNAKQKIILTIKEKTGIELDESEITLSKKVVVISTSSVKKASLLQKGSKDALTLIGYTLQV